MDQIYDLCTVCKQKLNIHLRKQDQQIGNYVLKKRKTQQLPDNLKSVQNNVSHHNHSNGNGILPKNDLINDKNNDLNNSKNTNNESIYNFSKNFSTTIKKAYTIAGTVPALVIGKSPSKEALMNGNGKHHQNSQQKQQSPKLANDSSLSPTSTKSNVKIKDKITSGSLGIIFEDMIVLFLNILIFICDFVNLINDSDLFNDNEQSFFKSDDLTWFQFFLTIYKHISTILLVNFILSLHGIYKR